MATTPASTPTEEKSKSISLLHALIPIIALVIMLFYNVFFVYGDDALSGSNQFILILGAAVAAIVGFINKISYICIKFEPTQNRVLRPIK